MSSSSSVTTEELLAAIDKARSSNVNVATAAWDFWYGPRMRIWQMKPKCWAS